MENLIAKRIQATIKQLEAQQEPLAQTNAKIPTVEQRMEKLEDQLQLRKILEVDRELQIRRVKEELTRTFQINTELAKDILELQKDLNKVIILMTNITRMLENNPLFASGSKTMN